MTVLAQKTFMVKRVLNGRTVTFRIEPNKRRQLWTRATNVYNPVVSSSSPIIVTPTLTVSGGQDHTSYLSDISWVFNNEAGTALTPNQTSGNNTWLKTSQDGDKLNIIGNLTGCTTLVITCNATYTDPASGLKLQVSASTTITKEETAEEGITTDIEPVSGCIFSQSKQSLQFKAHLYRSTVEDTSDLTYQWAVMDNGVATNLTDGKNGVSGSKTATLTIGRDAVLNAVTLRCAITDTDSNTKVRTGTRYAYITVFDDTDPIQIDAEFIGSIIVGDENPAKATFIATQGGNKITTAAFYDSAKMKVNRLTSSGALDTTWGTSGYKDCTTDKSNKNFSITLSENDLLPGETTNFGVQLEGSYNF